MLGVCVKLNSDFHPNKAWCKQELFSNITKGEHKDFKLMYTKLYMLLSKHGYIESRVGFVLALMAKE